MDLVLNQMEAVNPQHPLDPLSSQEIRDAVSMIHTAMDNPRMRFVSVSLKEPEKDFIDNYNRKQTWDRQVFAITYDPQTSDTHEWTMSLTHEKIVNHHIFSNVQPNILMDEFIECEEVVKADFRYQAAMKKRGIVQMDLVMIDPWSAGNYEGRDNTQQRLVRALSWVRQTPDDNGYAHPVEGLITIVDLNTMKVLEVEDNGVIPVPEDSGNYTAESVPSLRTDLKPLHVMEPDIPVLQWMAIMCNGKNGVYA